jgi:hypothetical protein
MNAFGAGLQKWRRWKERRGPNRGKSFANALRSSSPSGQSDRVRADDGVGRDVEALDSRGGLSRRLGLRAFPLASELAPSLDANW